MHAHYILDKTAPNVAFVYGNGEDDLKEIEIEEKQQLFDSPITAPLTRSCDQKYRIAGNFSFGEAALEWYL